MSQSLNPPAIRKVRINLNRPQPLQQIVAASTTPFAAYSNIVDPSGNLNFAGKASVGRDGIVFPDGKYEVKLADFELLATLGRGQFGVVQKVIHRPTNVTMALKEVRLELDQNKLNHIIMELEILHKSSQQNIIDFYGAFVLDNLVYIAIEYMDAGSLDLLYHNGIEEPVLGRIALSMLQGLNYLRTELNVMHRDVKPTNVLANTRGDIKLCDFGVSGEMIQSMAKTNVGCEPYMSPERITNGAAKYSSKSDVWSLGLSLVEMGNGVFPFKNQQKESIFSQLSAILNGPAPSLNNASENANNFIALCLQKDPNMRPSLVQLLKHPWIVENETLDVDMQSWIKTALDKKLNNQQKVITTCK